MRKEVLFKGKDITGEKFHQLTILGPAGHDKFNQRLVLVRCECGTEKVVRLYNVTSGATKSCGCIKAKSRNGSYCPYRKPTISPPGKVLWGGRDIAKKTFGELTILKETEPRLAVNGNYRRRVLCRCSCGRLCEKDMQSVVYGTTKSCGHIRSEMLSATARKHGMSRTKLYNTWIRLRSQAKKGMLEICPEWNDADNGFEAFRQWSEANGYNQKTRLTRKDRKEGFEPENCYWKHPKIPNQQTVRRKKQTK